MVNAPVMLVAVIVAVPVAGPSVSVSALPLAVPVISCVWVMPTSGGKYDEVIVHDMVPVMLVPDCVSVMRTLLSDRPHPNLGS